MTHRRRIGEFLVDEGFAKPIQIQLALARQRRLRNMRIGEILVELGVLTEQQLARGVQQQLARLHKHDGSPRLRFGEFLVEEGYITDTDVHRALRYQRRLRAMHLGDILVDMGVLDTVTLERALASQLQQLAASGWS